MVHIYLTLYFMVEYILNINALGDLGIPGKSQARVYPSTN